MHHFDFGYLYNFTHDPTTPQQFIRTPYDNQSIKTLTYDGCINAVGNGFAFYSRQDIYDRVLLWRVPLLLLWLTTVLPAFGKRSMFFTLVHLIADPIDTIWSMLYKLDHALRTIRWAEGPEGTLSSINFRNEADVGELGGENGESVRLLDANPNAEPAPPIRGAGESNTHSRDLLSVRAVIISAYDEWGRGDEARDAMRYLFHSGRWDMFNPGGDLKKKWEDTAFYIASDRVARLLPSIAASISFLLSVFAGFWKTLTAVGDHYNGKNLVSAGLNRAPHNIAFGVLFFWLPFVILMTGVIGGSQTSQVVSTALESLRRTSDEKKESAARNLNNDKTALVGSEDSKSSFPKIESNRKWRPEGMPVWQLNKYEDFRTSSGHLAFAWVALLLSIAIVAAPTGCAIAISWLTPTRGFGCRGMTQLAFLLTWLINVILDFLLLVLTRHMDNEPRIKRVFQLTFAKDFVILLGTIAALALSAEGVYNSCDCWCKWPRSRGYISFPQDDFIFQAIKGHLQKTFPIILGCALGVQIILFVCILAYFWRALRVLSQRDLRQEFN